MERAMKTLIAFSSIVVLAASVAASITCPLFYAAMAALAFAAALAVMKASGTHYSFLGHDLPWAAAEALFWPFPLCLLMFLSCRYGRAG
jgi:hypothetical protein